MNETAVKMCQVLTLLYSTVHYDNAPITVQSTSAAESQCTSATDCLERLVSEMTYYVSSEM